MSFDEILDLTAVVVVVFYYKHIAAGYKNEVSFYSADLCAGREK